MNPRTWVKALLAALSAAYLYFIIRGPARPICHDELNFLYEGLRLPLTGKLAAYNHGPLLFEIAALIESAVYAALRAAGRVKNASDYLVFFQLHLPLYSALAHAVTAAAGVAFIAQVYRLGLLFGDEMAAALSALFCAVNLAFINMTTFFKEDVFYWLFLFFALEKTWKAAMEQDRLAAAAAGIAIGAAAAAKYFGAFAAPLILFPLIFAPSADRRRGARTSLIMALSAAASLLMLFPFLLTDTAQVIKDVRQLKAAAANLDMPLSWISYLRHHLPNTAGPVVMALGGAELARRLLREPRGPIALALIPLATLLFLAAGRKQSFSYYSFPTACFLMILVCAFFSRKFKSSAPYFAAVILLLDSAYLQGALKYGLVLTSPDTRLLARDFLQARAEPGDCVLVNLGVRGENIFGPQLTPSNTPAGHGAFTNAAVISNQLKPGPKYALRISDTGWVSPEAARGCRWLALGRRGAFSRVEYNCAQGPPGPADPVPGGFEKVGSIEAFPQAHCNTFPALTSLDYKELRSASLPDVWRRGALGLSYDFYRAQP